MASTYRKTQQQARLSHARVADEQQLRAPGEVSGVAHGGEGAPAPRARSAGLLTLKR